MLISLNLNICINSINSFKASDLGHMRRSRILYQQSEMGMISIMHGYYANINNNLTAAADLSCFSEGAQLFLHLPIYSCAFYIRVK